jgi:hypothetical protein
VEAASSRSASRRRIRCGPRGAGSSTPER